VIYYAIYENRSLRISLNILVYILEALKQLVVGVDTRGSYPRGQAIMQPARHMTWVLLNAYVLNYITCQGTYCHHKSKAI